MSEETTIIEEETTTQPQEPTQEQEQSITSTSEQETTTTTTTVLIDVAEGFPDNSDSELHELFAGLGVDLDYVPKNGYQAFSMACSLIVAVVFLWWFCNFLFALSRDIFK